MSTTSSLKKVFKAAQRRVPLWVWQRLMRRPRITVNYHLVSDQNLPHLRWLLPCKTPRQFSSDVESLCLKHRVLADEELDRQQPLASPPFSITFDDGLKEVYTVVRPILRRYRVRAFIFIITECIDNRAMMYRHKAALCIEHIATSPPPEQPDLLAVSGRVLGVSLDGVTSFQHHVLDLSTPADLIDELCQRLAIDVAGYLAERRPYLSSEQIRELAEDGHVIGAHSVNHPALWSLRPEEIEKQMVESCATIAALTGREQVPFSAPYSLEGVDRSLLLRIAERHPQIGQIFGTSGVLLEPEGILSRVGGDDPTGAGEAGSNLSTLVLEAYLFEARRATARWFRRKVT